MQGSHMFPIAKLAKYPPLGPWRDESTAEIPRLKAWQAEHTGCNWGMDCGKSGWLILDLDNQDAIDWYEARCLANGGIPVTREVRTPREGKHVYFRNTGGWGNSQGSSKTNDLHVKADIRGVGGYVLLPGSRIENDKVQGDYVLIDSSPIASPSSWLADMLSEAPKRQADTQTPACPPDQPFDVAAAERIAQTAPVAIEGEGGDLVTFQTACRLRDLGVSQTTCLVLMAEHYNPRCEPPWDLTGPISLEGKVASAYRNARDVQGNSSVSPTTLMQLGQVPVFPAPPAVLYPDERKQAGWYAEQERVPKQWLIEGFVPSGPGKPTLLTGPPGAGKSLTALAWGISAAVGGDWMGRQITQVDEVLLVLCEDGDEEIIDRVQDYRNAHPDTFKGANVHILTRVGKETILVRRDTAGVLHRTKEWDWLDAQLTYCGGPERTKLLILDTARDIAQVGENDNEAVSVFIKGHLNALSAAHNATTILLHHPAKAEGSLYAGAGAWQGSFRNHVHMESAEDMGPGVKRIWVAQSNYGAPGLEVFVVWQDGVWIRVDEDGRQLAEERAVHDFISQGQLDNIHYAYRQNGARRLKDQAIYLEGDTKHPMCESTKHRTVERLLKRGLLDLVTGERGRNGLHAGPWPRHKPKGE